MSIINKAELEIPIRDIEKVLFEYDQEEQQLIMKYINERIIARLQKLKVKETAQDALSGMNPAALMKKFMKGGKDE